MLCDDFWNLKFFQNYYLMLKFSDVLENFNVLNKNYGMQKPPAVPFAKQETKETLCVLL